MTRREPSLPPPDIQKDFCLGGKLAVPEGDQIVPVLNEYIEKFKAANLPVFATRDWHPEQTIHFNTGGGVWPPHCIQGTEGAEFHSDLALFRDVVIISCGTRADEQGKIRMELVSMVSSNKDQASDRLKYSKSSEK